LRLFRASCTKVICETSYTSLVLTSLLRVLDKFGSLTCCTNRFLCLIITKDKNKNKIKIQYPTLHSRRKDIKIFRTVIRNKSLIAVIQNSTSCHLFVNKWHVLTYWKFGNYKSWQFLLLPHNGVFYLHSHFSNELIFVIYK